MTKLFRGALYALPFLFIACSSDNGKDDLIIDPNVPSPTVSEITHNGEPISEDINVDAKSTSIFNIKLENISEDEIQWILDDEVIQEGGSSLELNGRSGLLDIAVKNNSDATTRANANDKQETLKRVNLIGRYNKGFFLIDNNYGYQTESGYMGFFNSILEPSEEYNVLYAANGMKSDSDEAIIDFESVVTVSDMTILNNKMYLVQRFISSEETQIIVADAQTLKIIKKSKPHSALEESKLVALNKDLVLVISTGRFEQNLGYYLWDVTKDSWEQLQHTESIDGRLWYPYANKAVLRAKDYTGIAFEDKIIVIDNKNGQYVKTIEAGENQIVMRIIEGKGNKIYALADAAMIDNEYVDIDKYPAKLIELDQKFNKVKENPIMIETKVAGQTVKTPTQVYTVSLSDIRPHNTGGITASKKVDELYLPLPKYHTNGELAIYRMNSNGVAKYAFTIDSFMDPKIPYPMEMMDNYLIIPSTEVDRTSLFVYEIKEDKCELVMHDDQIPLNLPHKHSRVFLGKHYR